MKFLATRDSAEHFLRMHQHSERFECQARTACSNGSNDSKSTSQDCPNVAQCASAFRRKWQSKVRDDVRKRKGAKARSPRSYPNRVDFGARMYISTLSLFEQFGRSRSILPIESLPRIDTETPRRSRNATTVIFKSFVRDTIRSRIP